MFVRTAYLTEEYKVTLIEFKYHDDIYYLEEKGTTVFSINVSDLKFNSLNFYEGIYKGNSPNIELVNKLESDPRKKGTYIFSWLSDIISGIRNEFPDTQSNGEDVQHRLGLFPCLNLRIVQKIISLSMSTFPILIFQFKQVKQILLLISLMTVWNQLLGSDNSKHDPISRKDLDSFKILGKVLI